MKRRLFTLAAAVSLPLCGATIMLWVRSYWVRDELGYIDDVDDGLPYRKERADARRPAWAQSLWHDEWRMIVARGAICILHDRSDVEFRSGFWFPSGRFHRVDPVHVGI